MGNDLTTAQQNFDQKKYSESIPHFKAHLQANPVDSQNWNKLGICYKKTNQLDEAIRSYQQALEIDQQNERIWNNLGNIYDDLQQYSDAQTAYKQAIEINKSYESAWNGLGAVLNNLGKFNEAIQAYDKAIELKPNNHIAWNNKGLALQSLRKYKQAELCFRKALELNPKYISAINGLCNIVKTLGQGPDEELLHLNRILEIDPAHLSTLRKKGILLSTLNRHDEAIQILNKSISISDNNDLVFYNKGLCLENLNKPQEAYDAFSQAIALNPKNQPALYRQALYYFQKQQIDKCLSNIQKILLFNQSMTDSWLLKGNCLLLAHNIQEALQSFDMCTALNHKHGEAWKLKAKILGDLKRYDQALKAVDNALIYNTPDEQIYNLKGVLCYNKGDKQEALQSYQKAAEINPKNQNNLNNVGITLIALGRQEEALLAFEKAAQTNPTSEWAYSGQEMGQHEEAVKTYKQGLKNNPKDESMLNNLGVELVGMEKFEQALEVYNQLIELNSKNDFAWSNQGQIFQRLNQTQESLECYERALEISEESAFYYVNAAKCQIDLGRIEPAKVYLNAANEILLSNKPNNYSQEQLDFMFQMIKFVELVENEEKMRKSFLAPSHNSDTESLRNSMFFGNDKESLRNSAVFGNDQSISRLSQTVQSTPQASPNNLNVLQGLDIPSVEELIQILNESNIVSRSFSTNFTVQFNFKRIFVKSFVGCSRDNYFEVEKELQNAKSLSESCDGIAEIKEILHNQYPRNLQLMSIFIIMPIYQFNLETFIEHRNPNNEEKLAIALQIVTVVDKIHSQSKTDSAAHGRLNLHNILFDEQNQIVLTDMYVEHIVRNIQWVKDCQIISVSKFYSPERRNQPNFPQSLLDDVWALGMVLQTLFSENGIKQSSAELPNADVQNLPENVKEIVSSCLSEKPNDRPSVKNLVSQLQEITN